MNYNLWRMKTLMSSSTLNPRMRRLVNLLVLIYFAILLSACNQQLPTNPSQTAGPAKEESTLSPATPTPAPTLQPTTATQPVLLTPVDPAALRGVTLRFWHIWTGEAGQAMSALVEGFNAGNTWGIKIEAEPQANLDELYANLQAAFDSGQTPDVVVGFTSQAQAWDAAGQLADLMPYVNDPTWGLSPQEQADFYPIIWQQDAAGGKRLGLPALRSTQLLFYNQTWAKELGFAVPPATPDEFKQQACAAAKAYRPRAASQDDKAGGFILSTDTPAVMGWMEAFGAEVLRPGGDGYNFDTPEVRDTLKYLRGLYDAGCAWLLPDNQPPQAEFAGRRGLFSVGSLADLPYQAAAIQQAGSGDEWTVLPFPSPNGKPALIIYGPSYEILASTPERQLAAWLFLKWLVAPENQARLATAAGAYPTRAASVAAMGDYPKNHPQWAAALNLLPLARPEPSYRSWGLVRWAVSDAATQLFRYYFNISQVPELGKLLDQTAADLHADQKGK